MSRETFVTFLFLFVGVVLMLWYKQFRQLIRQTIPGFGLVCLTNTRFDLAMPNGRSLRGATAGHKPPDRRG